MTSLGPTHQIRLLWQGAFLASGVLAAYAWGHLVRAEEWQYTRTLALSVLVLAQLLHVYNVRAQGTSVWKLGFGGNRVLSIGVLASLALHLLVVYTPLGQRLFETVAVDPARLAGGHHPGRDPVPRCRPRQTMGATPTPRLGQRS